MVGPSIENLSRNQLLASASFGNKKFRITELQEPFHGDKKRKWVKGDLEYQERNNAFLQYNYSRIEQMTLQEVFELFINDEVIELILEESNRYKTQHNYSFSPIEKSEIYYGFS